MLIPCCGTADRLRLGVVMNAREFLQVLAALRHEAGSGWRLENAAIGEIAELVDDIALSLHLQADERHMLMMARAAALGGHPAIAIAKIESILRAADP
jgi:hypothetical protein